MGFLALRNLAFPYHLGQISASPLTEKHRGHHYLPWRLLRISVFSLARLSWDKTCYFSFGGNFHEFCQLPTFT